MPHSESAATASDSPGARAGRAAQAVRSRLTRAAIGGDSVEHALNLFFQLVRRRAVHIQLRANRIADSSMRCAARREIGDQERFSFAAERFDALEVVWTHCENQVGGANQIA